jgi:hypothetical protein
MASVPLDMNAGAPEPGVTSGLTSWGRCMERSKDGNRLHASAGGGDWS